MRKLYAGNILKHHGSGTDKLWQSDGRKQTVQYSATAPWGKHAVADSDAAEVVAAGTGA